MAEETLVERLKRLQSNLARVCAETADLRSDAASQSRARELSESPIKTPKPRRRLNTPFKSSKI